MSFPEDEDTLAGESRRNSTDKSIESLDKHTLRKRPWRRRVTPFSAIALQPYEGKGTQEEPYIISWLPEDPENPLTYSQPYKWKITVLVAISTLSVALASSAYSGEINSLRESFPGASQEVLILGLALFVLGFALGPLLWAPAAEIWGRRNVFMLSYAFFTLWNSVGAASTSIAQVVVFRFLAGAWGSAPLVNSGGTLADMFQPEQRGLAMAVFATAPFLGPALGPIVGSFTGQYTNWRVVQAVLGSFSGVILIIGSIFVPETYAPRLLRARARRLAKYSGKYYRASMDAKQELVISDLIKTSLIRPWVLLFLEPIVLILSIYIAIVYGILYLLFSAYPQVYQVSRGWSQSIGSLAFIPVAVGILCAVSYIIFIANPGYIKQMKKHGGRAPAEARLPPAIVGSVALVVGLVWFAASCAPGTHWIVPILSGAPFGFGMCLVFVSLQNYLVDSYVIYASSVMAANSLLRSLFGAAFPLFTTQMYERLGVSWASAIPAFLAFICLPAPYIFYRIGASIRMRCKYSKEAAEVLERMLEQTQFQSAGPDKTEEVQEKQGEEGQQSARKQDV